MENKKRLIAENDIYALFEENGTARLHVGHIDALPRVDAVEVVRITEVKQEILKVMDEFVAEWLGITQSYIDIFRAKIEAMEIAKRLVNAALNDLCDDGGAKMDGDGNG